MNLFGGLALTSPFMLLLVPGALAALVYAYRRYGRGQRKAVGTVLLLKALERTASARQKFEPPPRFFLELLLLTLLLLGAAGLYRKDAGGTFAVVIDTSMSMAATVPGGRENLLTRAGAAAASVIDSFPSDARVALITTDRPNLIEPAPIQTAYDRIERLQPTYSADNLERLLARLGGDARFDRVLAFTDRPPQYLSPDAKGRIEVTTVGERTSSNIAVSDIALTSAPSGSRTLRATVTSYHEQPLTIEVTAEGVDLLGVKTVVKREVVDLPAKASRSLEFGEITLRPAAFRVSASLRAGSFPGMNSLPLDDVAWVSAAPPAEQITVVSDLSVEALGLHRLRHLRFEAIKPSAWNERTSSERGTTIFHRFTPNTPPPGNALFVMPPPGGIFESRATANDAAVTRWNDGDPLAAYLNLPALSFKVLSPLVLPPWGREAIATTEGTAAFSGTFEGNRYIVTGFEVFPYEGSKSRIMSVLTLNALGWLADSSIGFEPVGVALEPTESLERARYVGGDLLWESGDDRKSSIILDQPGLLAVKTTGEMEQGRVLNFFDERESNTLTHLPVTVGRVNVGERETTSDNRYLTSLIAMLGILLIIIDIVFFHDRSRYTTASTTGRNG